MKFRNIFVHIILARFRLLNGQLLWRLKKCSLCFWTFYFKLFPVLVLRVIAPVPGHCILVTFASSIIYLLVQIY